MFPHFAQGMKYVTGTAPVTTNGGVTGDYISLKYAHRVWIKWSFTQAVAHQTVCAVNEATSAAGAGAAAMTATQANWYSQNTASDTLTKGTDAANVTLANTTNPQVVWMEIDPAKLTSTTTHIAATASDSSQATDFVQIDYFIAPARYQQATPPTAIT